MTSKRRPRTGSKRSPRSTSRPSRLRRAFSRALSTARRLRSIAVARAPRRAAVSPRMPVPVHTSSTVRPASGRARQDAAEQGGVAGRAQDPGEDDDAHACCTLPSLSPRQSPRWVASAHDRDRQRRIAARALRWRDGPHGRRRGGADAARPGHARPAAGRRARARGPRRRACRCARELPAAQVETASPVCDTIDQAARALAAARRELGAGRGGLGAARGRGHAPVRGGRRARCATTRSTTALKAAFPWALPRQLVFGLHVHVAVRGADRALAVLNAVRSHLPDLAALAGNAPLHAGRDTGLASVRPEIAGLLPRQGVPPAFASWEAYADYLAWGRRGGLFPDRGRAVVGGARRTTSWARSSCACPTPRPPRTRRPACSRSAPGSSPGWPSATTPASRCRCTTRSASPRTAGARCATASAARCSTSTAASEEPARARVLALIDRVAPAAERLGGAAALDHARTLAARNGAERQRAIAAEHGPRRVVEMLADGFLP